MSPIPPGPPHLLLWGPCAKWAVAPSTLIGGGALAFFEGEALPPKWSILIWLLAFKPQPRLALRHASQLYFFQAIQQTWNGTRNHDQNSDAREVVRKWRRNHCADYRRQVRMDSPRRDAPECSPELCSHRR